MDREDRHLTAGEIASYVDGRVERERRPAIEAHLADCDRCRSEVVSVTRDLRSADASRARDWRVPAILAAGLVGLAAVGVIRAGSIGAGSVTRFDEPGEGTVGIEVVHPEDGEALAPQDIEFMWRSSGPDAFYRITVLSRAGDVVWRTATRDTLAAFPTDDPATELLADRDYFWYVDTLLDRGGTATTGIRVFRVNDRAP